MKSALAAENKTIVRHLLEKFGKVEKVEEFDFEETEEETENEVKMEAEEETTERTCNNKIQNLKPAKKLVHIIFYMTTHLN